MKCIKITGLALLTALALSAFSASTASAECLLVSVANSGNLLATCVGGEGPNRGWVRASIHSVTEDKVVGAGNVWCARIERQLLYTADLTNSYTSLANCLGGTGAGNNHKFIRVDLPAPPATGSGKKAGFNLLPASAKFTAGSEVPSNLSAAGNNVECQSTSSTGEITSMDSIGKLTVKFTQCLATTESGKCTVKSTGAAEGELVTAALVGLFGTVKSTEADSEVGLLLQPEGTTKFLKIEAAPCLATTSVTGSVAGEVAPIGEKVSFANIALNVSSAKQEIQQIAILAGNVKPELKAFGVTATEESGEELEFGGLAEIF